MELRRYLPPVEQRVGALGGSKGREPLASPCVLPRVSCLNTLGWLKTACGQEPLPRARRGFVPNRGWPTSIPSGPRTTPFRGSCVI